MAIGKCTLHREMGGKQGTLTVEVDIELLESDSRSYKADYSEQPKVPFEAEWKRSADTILQACEAAASSGIFYALRQPPKPSGWRARLVRLEGQGLSEPRKSLDGFAAAASIATLRAIGRHEAPTTEDLDGWELSED